MIKIISLIPFESKMNVSLCIIAHCVTTNINNGEKVKGKSSYFRLNTLKYAFRDIVTAELKRNTNILEEEI